MKQIYLMLAQAAFLWLAEPQGRNFASSSGGSVVDTKSGALPFLLSWRSTNSGDCRVTRNDWIDGRGKGEADSRRECLTKNKKRNRKFFMGNDASIETKTV